MLLLAVLVVKVMQVVEAIMQPAMLRQAVAAVVVQLLVQMVRLVKVETVVLDFLILF
jgi:hypothetical protein